MTSNLRNEQRAIFVLVGLMLLGIISACANIGNPEGGPYDMTPPRLLKADPSARATEVKKQRLKLTFDEYVKLSGQDQVVVSPPQLKPATITAVGKDVLITLQDSLREHMTYSIYFGDAIVDNNEDNAIADFAYTFSTGSHIDTMQMSGVVVDAYTLEPVGSLLIGAYYAEDASDSLVRTQAFPFASKTSKMGQFTIRGLRDSTYIVFALKDDDNDLRFNGVSEGLAFDPTVLRTTKLDSLRTDTIKIDSIVRRDTITRDSLVTRDYTYYYPQDIVLRYFLPSAKREGIDKHTRLDSLVCRVDFLTPPREIPSLRSLDLPERPSDELYHAVRSNGGINYWLREPALIGADSIRFAIDYQRTDSLMQVSQATDTLTFYKPRERTKPNRRKEPTDTIPRVRLSMAGADASRANTPEDSLKLISDRPLATIPPEAIIVEMTLDSVQSVLPYKITPTQEDGLVYHISFERTYGAKYRVRIDSAAVQSIYGEVCDSLAFEQKTLPQSELSSMEVIIKGLGASTPVMVELLDKSERVLRSKQAVLSRTAKDGVSQGEAPQDEVLTQYLATATQANQAGELSASDTIPGTAETAHTFALDNLPPGEYYLRLYLDSNGDGLWTTGAYPSRQPEVVYYSPAVYALKKGFTTKEDWTPTATSVLGQKPEALRKVKPEKPKERVDKNVEYYRQQANKKRL